LAGATPAPAGQLSWTARYGERHRLKRITEFPPGIVGPKKVRLYRRRQCYVLQWWDPGAKANLSDRVAGDLVAAITQARAIEERLINFTTSGQVRQRRLNHTNLVKAFLEDLRRRADADDIDPATVNRYDAALKHYLAFCRQPVVARNYPHVSGVNRDFRLQLAAFLAQRQVTPNGRAQAEGRPMKGQGFILDTVRALFEWAADPERGNLLLQGFRNPFLHSSQARSVLKGDPLAEPDITLNMAIDFIAACDCFHLKLFVPVVLFGLRAAEPCFLFREYLDSHWLNVPCIPELGYRTKGRRDKRLPLIDDLRPFWDELQRERRHGLLYERRAVSEGRELAPLHGWPLAEVIAEFRQRCSGMRVLDAAGRQGLRDAVLRDAGGLRYDDIEQEFHMLARRLGWPAAATLKDLRHLFATMLGNSAMPEAYRRYLMGHSPGKSAIVAYTHLTRLRDHYADAVRREWSSLIEAIGQRVAQLN
jgi:hypothetical protein